MAQKITIDIIIPSYNAERLLEKNLPVIIKNSPLVDKIIIVDDGGTDNAPEYLKKGFPQIICLRHSNNLGFSKSVNEGVQYSKADYLVFLNNDVCPRPGYIESTLKYFEDSAIFAVNFNEEGSSWPETSWHTGKLQYVRGSDKTKPHYSAWPSGGSCILKRAIWNQLGGFNEIYSPAYWEDIDIGWRAWKSGYKVVWGPDSQVVHNHESTFGLKNQKYMNLIKQRNELLFTWLNITDRDLFLSHLKFLITHSLKHLGYLQVIFLALLRLFTNRQTYSGVISDKEIIRLVNHRYE